MSFFDFDWDDLFNGDPASGVNDIFDFSRDTRNAQEAFDETPLESRPFCIQKNPTDQRHENGLILESFPNNTENSGVLGRKGAKDNQEFSLDVGNTMPDIIHALDKASHLASDNNDQNDKPNERTSTTSESRSANLRSSIDIPFATANVPFLRQGFKRKQSFKKLAPYPGQRNLSILPKPPKVAKGSPDASNRARFPLIFEKIPEDPSLTFNKQLASHLNQASPYSSSGFDSLGILSRIANRHQPKIDIGPVDLSCAFVLCEISRSDCPIVYVSEAFERLTGYFSSQIIGRNCRFLQDPEGELKADSNRPFVDNRTVQRLRSAIHGLNEIQASIINYRRGGRAFVNLLTLIPVKWDSDVYEYYVGFQVDLLNRDITRSGSGHNVDYRQDFLRQYFLNIPTPPDNIRPILPLELNQDGVTKTLTTIESTASRKNLGKMMVENVDDMIYILSSYGDFLYLSQACRKILGYEPNELVSKLLSTVCHPSDIAMVMREFKGSTSPDPHQFAVTFRISRRIGGYVWLESRGSWHVDLAKGRNYAVLGGRPRLTDPYQEFLFPPLPSNGFWAHISLSGVILSLSSRTTNLLGYSTCDSIGKTFSDCFKVSPPGIMSQALQVAGYGDQFASGAYVDVDDSGRSPAFSHSIRHKNGNFFSARTIIFSGSKSVPQRPVYLMTCTQLAQKPSSHTKFSENFPHLFESTFENISGFPLQPSGYTPSLIESAGQVSRRQYSPDPPSLSHAAFDCSSAYGGSWKTELSDPQKQNCMLEKYLRRLVQRRRKRATKILDKTFTNQCVTCGVNQSPEWRRGPSGKRDLCNRCGLRWARRVRAGKKE